MTVSKSPENFSPSIDTGTHVASLNLSSVVSFDQRGLSDFRDAMKQRGDSGWKDGFALAFADTGEKSSDKKVAEATFKPFDLFTKVGVEAGIGVGMLGAEKVKISNNGEKINIEMTRPDKASELVVDQANPPLVFGKQFSFDVKKNGESLKLSDIKGLSVEVGKDKRCPVESLTMDKKGGNTVLKVSYKDGNESKTTTVDIPMESTYDGFEQFLNAGAKLKK